MNSLNPSSTCALHYLDDDFVLDVAPDGAPRFRRFGTFDYYGILDDIVVWEEKPREVLWGLVPWKTDGRKVWATPYDVVVRFLLECLGGLHSDRRALCQAFILTHPDLALERPGLEFNGILDAETSDAIRL